MAVHLGRDQMKRGMPLPSLLLSTGWGLAAVWLLNELPKAAMPRWQGCLRALIDLCRPLRVDPACSDAARAFRLPRTTNPKTGRTLSMIGGTLVWRPFDPRDLAPVLVGARRTG